MSLARDAAKAAKALDDWRHADTLKMDAQGHGVCPACETPTFSRHIGSIGYHSLLSIRAVVCYACHMKEKP